MHYINQLNKNFIICGDLNGHSRRWEHSPDTTQNSIGNAIQEILDENDYISLATPPNMITYTNPGNGKTSTIDLCLTSTHLIPSINIRSMPDLASDHYPILVKLAIGPNRLSRGKRSKWIQEIEKWTTWQSDVMSHTPKEARNQEVEI